MSGGDVSPLYPPLLLPLLSLSTKLLQLGARVDATDHSRATALHIAVQFGQLDAVQMLTSAQADLRARDCFGKTPLHYACAYASTNDLDNTIAYTLIAAGADVHSLDELW